MPRARDHAGPLNARFDPEAFYVALDKVRRRRGMSWRAIRGETGVPSSTFTRMGTKWRCPSANNLVKLLVWAGITDIGPFIARSDDVPATEPGKEGSNS
jgi:hypothetical protein